MKIKLVFDDWRDGPTGKSLYSTPAGIQLSMGDFHSGTTFDGEIDLDIEQEKDIKESMELGAVPVFRLYLPKEDDKKIKKWVKRKKKGQSPEGNENLIHPDNFTDQERRNAMDCQWMTDKEIDQAIPPAYTEWIGKQLMKYLKEA